MKIPNQIYPVISTNPYKPDHGDLVCEFNFPEMGKYLETPSKERFKDKQVLPLRLLSPNPWKALTELRIKAEAFHAPYECPYTGYTFYSIVPSALISDDLKGKYGFVNHWNKDYLFDYEFQRDMFRDNILELGTIGDLILGSGYTEMTHVNDGSRSKLKSIINLDNGDKLYVHFWEWHNK